MWLKRIGVGLLCGLFGFTTAGCFARGGAGTRTNATAANLIILGAGVAMATAAALSDGDEDCGESNHPSAPCIDGAKLLDEAIRSPLPCEHLARIAADVCAGLHHAHSLRGPDGKVLGLVHRDVSPQNVLIGRASCRERV